MFGLRFSTEHRIVIAIAIPIKNRSGKIGNRFPYQNRSAIFISKSIRDEKTVRNRIPQSERQIGIRFSYENRSAIPGSKPDRDFHFEIGSRIYFFDRDRDPDQKSFRKNRKSIFMLNSISDFRIKIDQRFSILPVPATSLNTPHQALPEWAVPNGARNRPRLPVFPDRTATFQQKAAPQFPDSFISAPVLHFCAIPAPGNDHIWQRCKGRLWAPTGWAYLYSRRQQNANTDVFSQGDFCRIGVW